MQSDMFQLYLQNEGDFFKFFCIISSQTETRVREQILFERREKQKV